MFLTCQTTSKGFPTPCVLLTHIRKPTPHKSLPTGGRGGLVDEDLGGAPYPSVHLLVPVHRLHLPRYANDSAWQEVVKFLKQFPNIGLVLQVEVQLNYP